jgi:hypothetical protein
MQRYTHLKAITIPLTVLGIWIIIAHFFPSGVILGHFIFFPFLLLIGGALSEWPGYLFIPFGYALLLLSDYLLRLFAGGTHDDEGRGWMELSFYITLASSTITLTMISLIMTKRVRTLHAKLIFMNILSVLACASLTLLFFCAFSRHL